MTPHGQLRYCMAGSVNDEVEAYQVVFRSEDLAEMRRPELFLKALHDTDKSRKNETILLMESPETRKTGVSGSDAVKVLDATILLAKTPDVAEELADGLRDMGRRLGVEMDIHVEDVTFRVDKIMQMKGNRASR